MIFTRAERTTNVTINNAAIEIIAGAKGCFLRALSLTLNAATASVFGIGRPAAAGITPTTPVPFHSQGKPGDVSVARYALAWGTSPTAPAVYHGRVSLPATIGAGWTWPPNSNQLQKIWIPPLETLVLFNITGTSAADVVMEIEE
ncbi:MAG TPA: hypothetical protein VK575_11770 [Gemmatimonadaceae bacterium]|nr:hypothetical protein [Gemmatimonadaceae bacterium]